MRTSARIDLVAACALSAAVAQVHAAELPLEEVTVTAQRREQGLQDVPVAVSALSAETLAERGVSDFSNYLSTIPGASVVAATGVGNEIKFRGVGVGNTFQQSPTTAIYLGEVPIIHTGRNNNSSYNFQLVDMERVEVLRGPQGQLFGANSLGGAVRNIPAKPRFGEHDARINVGSGQIEDGSTSWNTDVTLNAPFGDAFAARVTLYQAQQGGWYDNAFRGGPAMASLAAQASPYFNLSNVGGPPFLAPPGATLPAFNVIVTPNVPPNPPGVAPFPVPGVLAIHPNPAAAAAFAAPAPTDAEDTNETRVYGGRAMLSWAPSDVLRIDFMAAVERRRSDGGLAAEYIPAMVMGPAGPTPSFGAETNYKDYEFFDATTTGIKDEIELYNLVIDYDFGGASLTSSTAYWDRTEYVNSDFSVGAIAITGVSDTVPMSTSRPDHPRAFIQELRLTSDSEGRVDWLVGAFYEEIDQLHRVTSTDQSGLDLRYWTEVVRANGNPLFVPTPADTTIVDTRGRYKDEQFALFGQLGFDFTDTIHAAISARWLNVDQSFTSQSTGFTFTLANGEQSGEHSDDVFTPRVEVSWQPQDDQLYYASATQGYRTGSTNRDVPMAACGIELAAAGFPNGLPPVDSDTLWNYELGAKFDLLDRRLRVNGAVYYIDWKDVQQIFLLPAFNPFGPQFSQCLTAAVANMGDATSQGAELEITARVTDQFTIDWAASYTDAQFDETIMGPTRPFVTAGQTMPLTAEITSALGLQWNGSLAQRPVWSRFEWQYIGDKAPMPGELDPNNYVGGIPFKLGDYHQLNARAGLDLTDKVRVELYVTNLTDEFGIAAASDSGGFGLPQLTTIQPRTYGAALHWKL